MSQVTKSVICYSENTPNDISISVNIGYAQPSMTKIFVGGKLLTEEIRDSFHQKRVGSAKELVNKEFVCFTTVSDMNPNTTETSLKVEVYEGNKVLNTLILGLKANEGGVVFYNIYIIII